MNDYLQFKGKVALVTGGARGIGKATALKLAKHGADIVVVYYNSSTEANELVTTLEAMGRKAIAIQANVADLLSIKEMMEVVKSQFSRIDFLISNAASGVLKPLNNMSTKHFRWCMETNALACHHLVQACFDLLQEGGRVIALSSLGALRAIPNYGFIGASKAALEALIRSWSIELAPKKVTANVVSAGVVDTDALKHFPNRAHLLDEYAERALSDRPLLPSDVADAIYLLCLPESQMINAHTLFVDAGYSEIG
jgi:enoyl-[acyl-carrier protein] reductase III